MIEFGKRVQGVEAPRKQGHKAVFQPAAKVLKIKQERRKTYDGLQPANLEARRQSKRRIYLIVPVPTQLCTIIHGDGCQRPID